MARYAYNGTVRDKGGRSVGSATITVYEADTTTAATIYAAKSGGSAISGGQVTSGTDGTYIFYADTDDYGEGQLFDLSIAKTGYSTQTIADVAIPGVTTAAPGDVYGSLYVDDNDVVVNLTDNTNYFDITGYDSAGPTEGVTASATNGTITVSTSGIYYIAWHASFTHASNNTVLHCAIHLDDTKQLSLSTERKVGTGGDIGAAAASGILTVTANQAVSLKVKSEDNTGNATFSHIGFTVQKIAEPV